MRLPPFEYLEPANVEEALSMMDTYKETVKIMAGGTDVINRMKLRLIEPAYVMNIGKLKTMDSIETGDAEIVIGANVRLKEIATMPFINKNFRAIAEAALKVASPTITAMATIGGNILQNSRCMFYNQSGVVLNGLEHCHKRGGNVCLAVKGSKKCFSVYQSDLAPAIIAFNARCVIEKKGSSRTIPLVELFTNNGISPFAIGVDELLTKIIISTPEGAYSSAYRKLRIRGSIDYPLASAAACVSVDNDIKVTSCRVVIGAAGAAPKVIDRASLAVEGKPPADADLDVIAQMAYEEAEAVDNLQMPASYRRKMISVLVKRVVKAAFDEIKGGV